MSDTSHLPKALQNLSLPVIGSPMFIASGPKLVAAQCKAGIVGAFPALNARPAELLDTWLTDLQTELAAFQSANPEAKVGPIAVNQIVHQSNDRLAHDVEMCVKHQVPIIISSLRAPMTGATAITAVQPHTAAPTANNRDSTEVSCNGFVSTRASSKAVPIQTTTTGIANKPTCPTVVSVSRIPTSAIPVRSNAVVTQASPGSSRVATPKVLRQITPNNTAHSTGLSGVFPVPNTE